MKKTSPITVASTAKRRLLQCLAVSIALSLVWWVPSAKSQNSTQSIDVDARGKEMDAYVAQQQLIRDREHARTRGNIEGQVRDKSTGRPLKNVMVAANSLGSITDEAGHFRINILEPGMVTVFASRDDLISVKQNMAVVAGKTTPVMFEMVSSAPPCCRLEGKWAISFQLMRGKPVQANSNSANGTIHFSTSFWTRLFREKVPKNSTLQESGEYEVDLRPFFGNNIASAASSSEFPDGNGFANKLKEASGSVFNGNEVHIQTIPQLSHGGLALDGHIDTDGAIRGHWIKRDYAPMHSGSFVMTRL
ncbi:carboxypeptidase-like regulatory domain-containing protein [Massilia rubra]|uniref:Carboxypeptidase-like regulatory domain-containing protein n=1 Tax=Massilia rubra TaxID=2607910 RepID=A0ABX0LMD3_9BURK|nr:carboxypeptidase-like regulatory domain-containing protein [Massilia rubra]NHZ35819.1 carboxypeptidase-like regulatory domain-containing protein [Massilia rubra]